MKDVQKHKHNCQELVAIDISGDGNIGIISFALWTSVGTTRELVSVGLPGPALYELRDALTQALDANERDQGPQT